MEGLSAGIVRLSWTVEGDTRGAWNQLFMALLMDKPPRSPGASELRVHRHDTDVVQATNRVASPDDYAGVIVAASVNAGGYQKNVRRWVRMHAQALARRPNAFVSVCLGVLQREPEVDAHLRSIVDAFASSTGWRPDEVKVVAGALPYTKYNLITRWVMKRIVSKAGGDTARDYEYTDWDDVRLFAEHFGHQLETPARPAAKVVA